LRHHENSSAVALPDGHGSTDSLMRKRPILKLDR
jgi:hypothetical protein